MSESSDPVGRAWYLILVAAVVAIAVACYVGYVVSTPDSIFLVWRA